MAKKSGKKAKKAQKRMMEQQAAAWAGGFPPPRQQGLFAGLSRMLPKGRAEQFLLGAAIGAAAAYVLSDEELRGKLLKSGMKLYTGLVGGLEEVKEQMADIQAEMAAEQDGLM